MKATSPGGVSGRKMVINPQSVNSVGYIVLSIVFRSKSPATSPEEHKVPGDRSKFGVATYPPLLINRFINYTFTNYISHGQAG